MDHFTIELWGLTVRGKQRHLLCAGIRLQYVDRAAPRGLLAIVDFAEIEHLALYDTSVEIATTFDDTPVPVRFAVLDAFLRSQVHEAIACRTRTQNQQARSALQRDYKDRGQQNQRIARVETRKIITIMCELRKSG